MSKKWYGSVSNRVEEGHFFGEDKVIREGTDITMYLWSDRNCYFVSSVVDQKHIFVLPYYVCADKSKPLGMGHQDWMYFKSIKEFREYIGSEPLKTQEPQPEEWVFRNNSWKWVERWTLKAVQALVSQGSYVPYFSPKEWKKLHDGQEVIRYNKLPGNISFGVREYYHDWEF